MAMVSALTSTNSVRQSADTTSFRKLRAGISSGVAWAGAVYQNRAVAVDGGIALMR